MRAAQQVSQALELPDSLASAILKPLCLGMDAFLIGQGQDSLEVAPISESGCSKLLARFGKKWPCAGNIEPKTYVSPPRIEEGAI